MLFCNTTLLTSLISCPCLFFVQSESVWTHQEEQIPGVLDFDNQTIRPHVAQLSSTSLPGKKLFIAISNRFVSRDVSHILFHAIFHVFFHTMFHVFCFTRCFTHFDSHHMFQTFCFTRCFTYFVSRDISRIFSHDVSRILFHTMFHTFWFPPYVSNFLFYTMFHVFCFNDVSRIFSHDISRILIVFTRCFTHFDSHHMFQPFCFTRCFTYFDSHHFSHFLFHTMFHVSQLYGSTAVVMANYGLHWKWRSLTPCQRHQREPIEKIFGTIDNVIDLNNLAKFGFGKIFRDWGTYTQHIRLCFF